MEGGEKAAGNVWLLNARLLNAMVAKPRCKIEARTVRDDCLRHGAGRAADRMACARQSVWNLGSDKRAFDDDENPRHCHSSSTPVIRGLCREYFLATERRKKVCQMRTRKGSRGPVAYKFGARETFPIVRRFPPMRLAQLDIDVLHALALGKTPEVGTSHRLRLELLGLAKDTPRGLVLTAAGKSAALSVPTIQHESFETPERQLDAMGRKLAAGRRLPGLS